MENISFIPNTQKSSGGYIIDKKENRNKGIIIWLISILVLYISILAGVYWFYIIKTTNDLNQILSNLDSSNSAYYPKGDLQRIALSLNDIISKTYDPLPVIEQIEATYNSDFTGTSWTYDKDTKTISLSVNASSIELVVAQIDKLIAIPSIANIPFPDINKTSNESTISFDLMIKLK